MIKLLKVLPSMCNKINKSKSKSLLSDILGIYTVKMHGMSPMRLILQNNCINVTPGNKLLQIFDLKGSTFKKNVINQIQKVQFVEEKQKIVEGRNSFKSDNVAQIFYEIPS